MKSKIFALLISSLLALPAFAENPRVELETDLGTIELELDAAKAPLTVENFLAYVDSGFYNGIIFHRVIPGFMAQAGGHTYDFQQKETRAPVKNESANGLSNLRGSIAMARTNDPDSASAQFFINLVDNTRLDGSEEKPGYTVFGKVVSGIEVVDKIAAEPRGLYRAFPDAPNTPVRILKAQRKTEKAAATAQTSGKE
jgi:peptidyl-prolyl cis-trans isomerase A (cyclophilin A)